MKIKRRASLELTPDAILYLLRIHDAARQIPYPEGETAPCPVRITVEGDGQAAEVTNGNPLVLSWDEEVEL